MSTATTSSPETLTEKFITEMIEETGCSVRFLNEAKAIILKLFKKTKGMAQQNCLMELQKTIQNQANSERATASYFERAEQSTTGSMSVNKEAVCA